MRRRTASSCTPFASIARRGGVSAPNSVKSLKAPRGHLEAIDSADATINLRHRVDPSVIFARWLAMDVALAEAMANGNLLPGMEDGADTTLLNLSTSGYLGSTVVFGQDALSLLSGSGQNLQSFQGLSEGLQKVA